MLYDLIIIGGGPAGITAGIYASRQKLRTLLITKGFGGQVARKAVMIGNYPGFEEISGMELIQKFEEHLRRQPIEIERDEVIKIQKVKEKFIINTSDKKRFEAKAIIVASGADPRPLEVSGEKKFSIFGEAREGRSRDNKPRLRQGFGGQARKKKRFRHVLSY